MASLFKDQNKLSAYRDRKFLGTQEEFEQALLSSTTVYIGNMSFYTTEEQVYELFTRAGEIKKIIMGLDKNSKTPCGFCLFYFDWGFQEGRQWGRGRSGGQVRDEYRTDYDPDILLKLFFQKLWSSYGGYGKLVQKELEAQRQLVDYGAGSLGSFPSVIPPPYGRHGGSQSQGGSYHYSRDYNRKRNEKMTVVHMNLQRERQIMNRGETKILSRDWKRIHASAKVVTLMRRRRIVKDVLSLISCH
ncbi:hypothetical protein NL676_000928 [Syzygium grande]|nr:hypothetical protein NL676_000928 [Syzygium grande]